jgi:putative ABC transport system substrate-binding protein
MISRRSVLAACLALPGLARSSKVFAQAKTYRIGYLSPGPPIGVRRRAFEAFRERLRDLGYRSGQLVIDDRWSDSSRTFSALADELVRSNPDAIVAVSGASAVAAKKSTTTVPIILASVPDPVGSGIVASLA